MRNREQAQVLTALVALFTITAAWWALALWPVHNGPEWIERTRYVCFGVRENGLPDAGGWIGLIAGPAGMLLILSVAWRNALQTLLERARSSRMIAATLAALALGGIVLISGAAIRVSQARTATAWLGADSTLSPGNYWRLDRSAPPLMLTAQNGAAIDIATLHGRPVLVTFAFAHCTTICPLIVRQALLAQHQLRDTAHEPAVLIVTLDPWRDTPAALPGMARSLGLPDQKAWVLSGPVNDVQATLDAWQVPRSRDASTGDITHPPLLFVVDRAGRLAYASTGSVAAIVSLLRTL